MANNILITPHSTGRTVYATIQHPDGTFRDVVAGAWDAFADADIDDYDVPATEIGTAGKLYQLTFPTLAAGTYIVHVYDQAGALPVVADDTEIFVWVVDWDGSAFVSNTDILADTNELQSDNYPARFDSVDTAIGALSVGSGSLSVNATGATITTGSETNDYTDTQSAGTIHVVEDAAGTTVFDYEFDLSAYTGTAGRFIWTGYVQSNNDTVDVQYYDWQTTAYITVKTLDGANGTTLVEESVDVPVGATGTGANFGLAKLRFTSTTATAVGTDRVRCEFATASGGITNGSTITLGSSQLNKNFIGQNWNLDLNGQDISGCYIKGAVVTGISSATSSVTFEDCLFGTATCPPGKYLQCGFGYNSGMFTAAADGQYILRWCYSYVPGSGTPSFDWSGMGAAVGLNGRGWHGGSSHTLDGHVTISWEVNGGGGQTFDGGGTTELRGSARAATITNHAAGKTSQIAGMFGPITVDGSGGTVNVYGHTGTITDNSSGTVTINSGQAVNLESINAEVDEALVDYDGVTTSDLPSNFSAMTIAATGEVDLSAAQAAEIADAVESAIVNEGDATAVLQAIADQIAADWVAGDASPLAIAAAVRTDLTPELNRIDVATSTRAAASTALTNVTWHDARAAYLDELAAANLPADVDTLKARITADLFNGMTSLPDWLRVLSRSDGGIYLATALTEINADLGGGAGTFDVWDSLQGFHESMDLTLALLEADVLGIELDLSMVSMDVDAILVDTSSTLPASIAVIDTNVDAILVDTGTTLPASLAVIDTNVDAILVDTGTTLPASLAVIDTNVDSILVDTSSTLPATLSTIDGKVDDIDSTVVAILVDTGTTLPASLAVIDTNVDSILVDTSSTLPATLSTIDGKVDDIDSTVVAILVDTGTTLPATLTVIDTNVDAILVDTGTTLPAALAVIDTNVDAILVDTGEIGVAGAGLTDLPWGTTWSAEVQGEVQDALEDNNLDHLAKTPTAAADMTSEVADGTILSRMLTKAGDTSDFTGSTDSMEGQRDWASSDMWGHHAVITGQLALLDGHLDDIDLSIDYITFVSASVLTDTGTTLPATLAALELLLDDVLEDTGTTLPATLAGLDGKIDVIDGNVDDVENDTAVSIPAAIAALPSAAAIADAAWDELQSGHVLAGSFGELLDAKVSEAGAFDPSTDVVLADLRQVLGTSLSESGAGDFATALNYFYGVDPPSKTMNDVGGGTTVGITATVNAGTVRSGPITIYQRAGAEFTWTVLDNDQAAIDLSDKSLVFAIENEDRDTQVFKVDGGGIVVSGAGNNVVTVTIPAADTDLVSTTTTKYRYVLRAATGDTPASAVYARDRAIFVAEVIPS